MENPSKHAGYDQLVWGLTASSGPDGYAVHSPSHDDGTISPTAAISAMPYTPQESLATLKHLYHAFGKQLWGYFGFKDAFNLDRGWFSNSYLAIDQGPIICMIENYRSGLCWKMFMRNAEIGRAIKSIGPIAAVAATTVGDHGRPPVANAAGPGSVTVPGPRFESAPILLNAAPLGH
jgi:hypothetical protein